jgi:hypothetical protein
VDAIIWLVLLLLSAWLAYEVTASERRSRAWGGAAAVGVFLLAFGAISVGLLTVWNNLLRPKLVDDFPSENTLLFVGLIVVAALVVLILDLLGTINVISAARAQMGQMSANRPSSPATGQPTMNRPQISQTPPQQVHHAPPPSAQSQQPQQWVPPQAQQAPPPPQGYPPQPPPQQWQQTPPPQGQPPQGQPQYRQPPPPQRPPDSHS